MRLDGNTAFKKAPTGDFYTGVVRDYYSLTKTYAVAIDGGQTRSCRQVYTGVSQPYAIGDHVLVIRSNLSSWLILGEYDPVPANDIPIEASTVDTRLAKQQLQFGQLLNPELLTENDFRPVDRLGNKEEPEFSGDATLHNKAKPFILRAFVKIFNFGDIFVKCSDACFIFFNRNKNMILTKATELQRITHGYRETIKVGTDEETAYKGIVDVTVLADAREKDTLDKRVQLGHIVNDVSSSASAITSSSVDRGERVVYSDHLASEIDNTSKTVRVHHTTGEATATLVVGSLNKENQGLSAFSGPVELNSAIVSEGIKVELNDTYSILFDASSGTLSIRASNGSQEITLSAKETLISFKDQFLRLDDTGLHTSVNNYELVVKEDSTETVTGQKSVTASGSLDIQTSGTMALQGTQILLN